VDPAQCLQEMQVGTSNMGRVVFDSIPDAFMRKITMNALSLLSVHCRSPL
jgi:hypothetical protein